MTFLPIVERELRVTARRRGTYWMRAAMGLVCIGLGAFLHLDAYMVPPRMLGSRIFTGLSWLALIYCLLAGRRSTADSLSEEKREGTLGLLFLTDLKGYDVVLGKMAATSLNAFYGLLAVFPVLAIPLLLGGVSSGQFWRVVLVLLDTFVLSLSIGMAASAVSQDARKALGLNLLILLCVAGGPPAFAAFIAYILPSHPFFQPLFLSCPIYSLAVSEDSMFLGSTRLYFWASVITLHVLSWFFLGLASLVLPHSWQDRTVPAKPAEGARTWRQKWHQFNYGTPEQRAALRRRLLEHGAYFWLTSRARFKQAQLWLFFFLVAAWWTWAWIKSENTWRGEALNPINVISAILVNSAFKIWLAIEAGRQIAEDRRAGAFELLLSTPLGPKEILRGQWRALLRQFLLPFLAIFTVEVLFMLHDLQAPNRGLNTAEEGLAGWLWITGLLILLADLVALGWVAMWTSLRYRSANEASIGTLVRILLIPWLLLWLASGIRAIGNSMSGSGPPSPEWPFFLGWWFWSGIAADLIFGIFAWQQLTERFRELAARPLSPSGSRVGGWFRRSR